MSLADWKSYIKEKRMKTSFRQFVQEIASRRPIVFHKNQGMMSRYPESERVGSLVESALFNEQRDGLLSYGREYDPHRPFFEQFQELFLSVPKSPTVRQMAGENTTYADSVVESADSYLSTIVINSCKNILYSFAVFEYCENVFNSVWVSSYSHNIYESVGIARSTNVFYSKFITNSSDIYFSTNLIGCSHCLLCDGLENQSYCYKNKQLAKEEYHKRKQEFFEYSSQFDQLYGRLKGDSMNVGSSDCTGNHVIMSANVHNGQFVHRLETGRNVVCVGGDNLERDFFDVFDGGVGSSDMFANEGTGSKSNNVYCSTQVEHSSNIFYSFYLVGCAYCLGCVGLKNKSYCILNKQYTKEEWHEKVNEIFAAMQDEGTLGSFFPASINPYYFNDTVASLLEEFDREEMVSEGFLWRDEAISVGVPQGVEVVSVNDLGQYETDRIDERVLSVVMRDHDGNIYRIVRQEYEFLTKHDLPLPRKHCLERIKGHFEG